MSKEISHLDDIDSMTDSPKELQDENFIGKLLRETIESHQSSGNETSGPLSFDIYFEKKLSNEDQFLKSDYGNESNYISEIPSSNSTQDLISFLNFKNITWFPGKYLNEIKCFRFIIQGKVMDFPQNWSFFLRFYSSMVSGEEKKIFLLSAQNDHDLLLKIISTFHKNLEQTLFLLKKEELFLIPIDSKIKNQFGEIIMKMS